MVALTWFLLSNIFTLPWLSLYMVISLNSSRQKHAKPAKNSPSTQSCLFENNSHIVRVNHSRNNSCATTRGGKDYGHTNIRQDRTLFCVFETGNIVCWLVNPPIAKLDLFKSPCCRWICKTYAEYCYRNSATVRRLVQSPTLQSTIFCGVHSGLRGKGIRVSPAW